MLAQSEKPAVGPLYKAGGADSQKLSVATKFKVHYFPVVSHKIGFEFEIVNLLWNLFFVQALLIYIDIDEFVASIKSSIYIFLGFVLFFSFSKFFVNVWSFIAQCSELI